MQAVAFDKTLQFRRQEDVAGVTAIIGRHGGKYGVFSKKTTHTFLATAQLGAGIALSPAFQLRSPGVTGQTNPS
jgi:hypothetical protein